MIPEWDELDSIKYESIAHFGVKRYDILKDFDNTIYI